MQWSDLKHGDRVHHFEYGSGTVNSAGPLWLLITWDDPSEYVDYHWSGEIDRHLTPLTSPSEARSE